MIQDPTKWASDQFRDTGRIERYATYAAYFDGHQELKFASKNLALSLRGIFDALTYNRCSTVVDALSDRLHLTGFVDPQGVTVEPAADLWAENRMDKREGEVNAEALIAGDAYAIVWPNLRTGRPTIWPEEARSMRVWYDDEEPGRLIIAAKYWRDIDGYGRLNLYLEDRLEKYITRQKATSGPPTAQGFERYEPDTDSTWPLFYDWFRPGAINIPVFHFGNNARTGRPGRSELRDVIPLQDGLNTTLAKLMAASEDAATPRIVIGGWTPATHPVTGSPADPFQRSDPKPFETINQKVAAFPDKDTHVQQLPYIDLTQLIALGEAFDLMIARTARIPVHYLGLTGTFPSGESLKTAEAPFVRKVMDRQTAFGNVWEDLMALALRQSGVDLTFQLDAVYEPATARSEREQAELAVLMAQTGMPLGSILRHAFDMDQDAIGTVLAEIRNQIPAMAEAIEGGALNDDLEGVA